MLLCRSDCYFLFDLPGQVELYTHHSSVRNIVQTMTEKWNLKVRVKSSGAAKQAGRRWTDAVSISRPLTFCSSSPLFSPVVS